MGGWIFTPGSAYVAPGASATLDRGGRRVDLRYSSSVLEEFLAAMSEIQADFDRLSHTGDPVGAHRAGRTGQSCHA
ncbi:hypothetical protein [Streptomyces sp. NPDC050856]|uniref:hypothetical protein n=1 Tax=Streptomyces sp. NPDC050856 TaxID=3154939 RepID=UPI0033D9D601